MNNTQSAATQSSLTQGYSRAPQSPPDSSSPEMESDDSDTSPPPPSQERRNHHNTHTRRCRARLNSRFDALHGMLPPPPGEVKHKVHILDHAIAALSHLQRHNYELELRLARRSDESLVSWVDTFAPNAASFPAAMQPLLRLIAHSGDFVYGELLCFRHKLRVESYVMCAVPLLQRALKQVAVGRVGACVDMDGGEIAAFALRDGVYWGSAGVRMMQAARLYTGVAIEIPGEDEARWIMAFYDVRERQRDEEVVRFSRLGAVLVSNCWAARQC